MNLRHQITNKLLELLFDGRHEYIPDCEDAALEVMKLITADKEPVESEITLPGLKRLAVKYRELMDERRLRIDAGESVESLDDDIDELLNETMLLTQSLLKDAPADSVDEPLRRIHVGVVCRNASGSPDVVFYFVEASESSIKDGYHLDSAIEMAGEDDYETPMIAFDEDDALYARLVVHIVPSSDKE